MGKQRSLYKRLLMRVLMSVQYGACFHCGRVMVPCRHRHDGYVGPHEATIEHVVPKSLRRDGDTTVVLAHRKCNEKRNDTPLSMASVAHARSIYLQARHIFDKEWAHDDTQT